MALKTGVMAAENNKYYGINDIIKYIKALPGNGMRLGDLVPGASSFPGIVKQPNKRKHSSPHVRSSCAVSTRCIFLRKSKPASNTQVSTPAPAQPCVGRLFG